jgi:hypothetical protein
MRTAEGDLTVAQEGFPMKTTMTMASAMLAGGMMWGQGLPAEIKPVVEAKAKELLSWGADPKIVAAVKAYNTNPPAEAKGMTNEKWKGLSVLDPAVRAFTKNELGLYLKTKKDAVVGECFVSGADGGKVAFLNKTTSWSHQGKDKHSQPMAGKTFFGPVEVDESSGLQLVQIGVPVMDGGKPIGSIVVGLVVSKLK